MGIPVGMWRTCRDFLRVLLCHFCVASTLADAGRGRWRGACWGCGCVGDGAAQAVSGQVSRDGGILHACTLGHSDERGVEVIFLMKDKCVQADEVLR